jgi:hypothetical protein
MVSVQYSLLGADGETIVFDRNTFVLNSGLTGTGLPLTKLRIDESAGVGGIFRYTNRGVRELDLPITVLGANRAQVQDRLRKLGRILAEVEGPPVLRAQIPGGQTLRLTVHYVAGGETIWGEGAGQTWAKWIISLRAPQPYWETADFQQFTITPGGTGRGLLPELTKLKLTSSISLGVINIDNVADVGTFPEYRVIGPIDEFEVTLNGRGFKFTQPLAPGEIIFVDTATGLVTDEDGSNRYDILAPAPKFFQLPTGSSSVQVNGTSTDVGTRIDLFYRLRYEVVH